MTNQVKSENIIASKSYAFALEIVMLYKYLSTEKKEFVLSKQVLRSGTSIGASVYEALSAESKRDFVHKLGISLKEARETSYWLQLLNDSHYIPETMYDVFQAKCHEITKILSSIILTTKEKYFKPNQNTPNS